MKSKLLVGVVAVGAIIVGIASSTNQHKPQVSGNLTDKPTVSAEIPKPTIPSCDGTTTTSGCTFEGIKYKTYVYHVGEPEKTHTEQVTTYEKKVTGSCTLCNDGTYSPTCATGSGACSHHGGVAQWNAPQYANVPVYTSKTVIDAPAKAAYYEKVAE